MHLISIGTPTRLQLVIEAEDTKWRRYLLVTKLATSGKNRQRILETIFELVGFRGDLL